MERSTDFKDEFHPHYHRLSHNGQNAARSITGECAIVRFTNLYKNSSEWSKAIENALEPGAVEDVWIKYIDWFIFCAGEDQE